MHLPKKTLVSLILGSFLVLLLGGVITVGITQTSYLKSVTKQIDGYTDREVSFPKHTRLGTYFLGEKREHAYVIRKTDLRSCSWKDGYESKRCMYEIGVDRYNSDGSGGYTVIKQQFEGTEDLRNHRQDQYFNTERNVPVILVDRRDTTADNEIYLYNVDIEDEKFELIHQTNTLQNIPAPVEKMQASPFYQMIETVQEGTARMQTRIGGVTIAFEGREPGRQNAITCFEGDPYHIVSSRIFEGQRSIRFTHKCKSVRMFPYDGRIRMNDGTIVLRQDNTLMLYQPT
jgi:hypothetical protein